MFKLKPTPPPLKHPGCAPAEGENGSHKDENPSKFFFFHDSLVDEEGGYAQISDCYVHISYCYCIRPLCFFSVLDERAQ